MACMKTAVFVSRWIKGRLLGLTLILGMLFPLSFAESAQHALVIGIDHYEDSGLLGTLEGAVADARDMEQAFRTLGFDTIKTFINEEAHRSAVLDAWNDILAKAVSGDTIFLTFSGHGMRTPARIADSEADGMDEFLPLHRFSDQGPGLREKFLDDEFAQWIDFAAKKEVRVVMVVDACHSGSTFRSVDRRASPLRYRFAGTVNTDDLFTGLDLDETISDEIPEHPRNLISFGASLDSQMVPELTFADASGSHQIRGALSYYFTRGLLGQADSDQNGSIAFDELKHYLERNIHHVTNGQQTPSIIAARDDQLIVSSRGIVRQDLDKNPRETPLKIELLDFDGDEEVPELVGAEVVYPGEHADLIWDARTGETISGIDGVVAYRVGLRKLQGVIDRHRAARQVEQLAEQRVLNIETLPKKPYYYDQQSFELQIKDGKYPYQSILVINADGRVALLYPYTAEEERPADPGKPLRISGLMAAEPFGADLVVAIASDHAPYAFIKTINDLSRISHDQGRATAMEAVAAIRHYFEGRQYRMGMTVVYTCVEGSGAC